MSTEPFKAGQRVKRKADGRVLRCLGEVQGRPGHYLCGWVDGGRPQQVEYDRTELEPFQFTGIIGINLGGHRPR